MDIQTTEINNNDWRCGICYESNVYPVKFNCTKRQCTKRQCTKHSITCYICAKKIDTCPICREKITSREFDTCLAGALGMNIMPHEDELIPDVMTNISYTEYDNEYDIEPLNEEEVYNIMKRYTEIMIYDSEIMNNISKALNCTYDFISNHFDI